ncbi:MAG: hypothetical protein IT553_03390 [Sphingomonadaceae bacterium]|nr:hypothetical protein [Sphingomonadaceae bacterium]
MTAAFARYLSIFMLLLAPQISLAAPRASYSEAMALPLARDPAATLARAQADLAGAANVDSRAEILSVLARAQFRSGDTAGARTSLDQLTALHRAGVAGRLDAARASLLHGLMAFGARDFGAALRDYRQAQLGFIAARDPRGQGESLFALSMLYNVVGDGATARRYLGLALQTLPNDAMFQLNYANGIGVSWLAESDFSASLPHFERARAMASRLNLTSQLAMIDSNIAWAHASLGNHAAAETALARMGPISAMRNPVLRLTAIRVAAMIALERGQYRAASRLLDSALAGVDPQTSPSSYRHIHYLAYQLAERTGNAAEALSQLEAVRRIDDADTELTASNRSALLAAQFQFSAQESRIQRLRAEQLARDVASQRRYTYTVAGAAVVTVALLITLVLMTMRSRNRAYRHAEQLAGVNVQLEKALAAKTEFLASTSHEIRTPLNGILGMTQIMLANRDVSVDLRAQIQLVQDSGVTMKALVDDILDVAKMEHGGFRIDARPTNVVELAERVLALYQTEAAARHIALQFDANVTENIHNVDADRLTQLLSNLVGNALKFTSEGYISLAVGRSGDGRQLQIAVRDSGIGIAAEWHEAVFEMFRQVDGSRSRSYAGSGLGLAICRQIARAMGGDIALESAEGAGSCFTVLLPWNPVAVSAPCDPGGPHEIADNRHGIALLAADPMRRAMLATMARADDVAILPIGDTVSFEAAAAQASIDWLVDGAALAQFVAQASTCPPQGRILLVGDVDPDALPSNVNGRVTFASFTRTMVAKLLSEWRDADGHAAGNAARAGAAGDGADQVTNAPNAPKRAAGGR